MSEDIFEPDSESVSIWENNGSRDVDEHFAFLCRSEVVVEPERFRFAFGFFGCKVRI